MYMIPGTNFQLLSKKFFTNHNILDTILYYYYYLTVIDLGTGNRSLMLFQCKVFKYRRVEFFL